MKKITEREIEFARLETRQRRIQEDIESFRAGDQLSARSCTTELLDAIPGAHARALLGRAQAETGEAIWHSALREERVGRSGR